MTDNCENKYSVHLKECFAAASIEKTDSLFYTTLVYYQGIE